MATKKEIEQFVERAEAARKARKAAPAVTVTGFVTVPQKDIMRRLASGDAGEKMHRMFVGRDQLAEYADKGYSPVVKDGDLVTFQSDVCVEITEDLYRKGLGETKAMSDALLGDRIKDDAAAAKQGRVGSERMTIRQVKAESLERAAADSADE